MHYTLLAAVQLPQDLETQIKMVPEEEIVCNITLANMWRSLGKKDAEQLPDELPINDQMRLEVLVDHLLLEQMEPYNENTEDPRYLEFFDCTEDGRKKYETDGTEFVRLLDGKLVFPYSRTFSRDYEVYEGKIYKLRHGPLQHRKRTKKAKRMELVYLPFRRMYASPEEFMETYYGYTRNGVEYGFFSNPNGEWDWSRVGGRWPNRFLVKTDCGMIIRGDRSFLLKDEPSSSAPEGYQWVAGARKCDIAWDTMKAFLIERATAEFHRLKGCFDGGRLLEEAPLLKITEEGITSWGRVIYKKEEPLEEFLLRRSLSEKYQYIVSTFAVLDDGEWTEQGWSEEDEIDEDTWLQMVDEYIDNLPDDAVLVSVDCHT